MRFIPQSIPEVVLIQPKVYEDMRGSFCETFRQDLLEDFLGHSVRFVQENESKSPKGVLRGLHFQSSPYAQSKLVQVTQGRVLDVVVDLRRGSPNYGCHVAQELSDEQPGQLFIPKGMAHGFVVLSEWATVSYKVDNPYRVEHEQGLAFDDPDLKIDWLLPPDTLILAPRDQHQGRLANLAPFFDYHDNLYLE